MSTTTGPEVSAESQLSLRASLARLSVRPRSLALLGLLPGLAVVAGVLGWLFDWRLGVDSAVYRAGALTLLQGDPLYAGDTLGSEPWWALLPFTYPPAAALLFTPLAFFPVQVAWGVVAAVSFLALALVVRITIAALPRLSRDLPRWASPARATLVFTIVFFGLEPVWRTIFLGQINIILMALVMVDVLVVCRRDSRWGGVLVGVAAAVKLTPLIFIPHLLFTGRKWDAARALGTFVGLQALMFAVAPSDAVRFWTHTVFNQGRIGPMHWAGNQSLNGFFNRVSDLAPWATTAALGLGALLAPFAIWVMLRFHRRGQHLYALLVTAFYALLVSPVSWSHHWVWAVPLIVVLVARLPQTTPATAWRRWVLAGSVVVVFLSCVLLVLPNGRNLELHWEFWQFVLGSAYLLVPVALTATLGVRWWLRRRTAAPEAVGDDTSARAG
ncbi:glycosyltransferase 87 family protein [Saccharomonospora sp. NB11]|jgi:alpha-1,2-mannosyltransferase|uniref:glycosyltransferase 87 family protein n=1 Tax=Saccharomonospora sp. NB11 TaxID=1642298 RepID=UPI0018D018F1|nr:glycosyltransferase 87 family protein [Saccharomonospora sp. NB11]